MAAAGSWGAGYGAALAKDIGLFDPSTAEAASPKKGTPGAPSMKLPGRPQRVASPRSGDGTEV
jgi:hypothetical protein